MSLKNAGLVSVVVFGLSFAGLAAAATNSALPTIGVPVPATVMALNALHPGKSCHAVVAFAPIDKAAWVKGFRPVTVVYPPAGYKQSPLGNVASGKLSRNGLVIAKSCRYVATLISGLRISGSSS
ncbi:hypothetical protein ACJU26_09805 [Acidithiobacillus sp. M4-SHS-6]|uniref:hypothetical protein n=1 Tax=Acidithiobacillus sp. M4-SHS-6 TaxID=3383024 RepID=UPI0039BE556F